jgi:hypothetical protein
MTKWTKQRHVINVGMTLILLSSRKFARALFPLFKSKAKSKQIKANQSKSRH